MSIKKFLPAPVRRAIAEQLGLNKLQDQINSLQSRINQLEAQIAQLNASVQYLQSIISVLESDSRLWDTSRERWREVLPDLRLTWGRDLTGDAFLDKVLLHTAFGASKTILELGPGYGRLLRSILEKKIEFARYIGIDISQENTAYLRGEFGSSRVSFIHADAEQCALADGFDVFLSSLTMKHLYPTFEAALGNLARYANDGCLFFFDLIEGSRRYFEEDKTTYIRWYTRTEVREILQRVGIHLLSFDDVRHDDDHVRLLVIAQKA